MADFDPELGPTYKLVLGPLIFVLTWLLITANRVPFLPIGRPAGALLGALLMVVCTIISVEEAYAAVDGNTIALLFGMMVITARLEKEGLFDYLAHHMLRGCSNGWTLLWRISLAAAFLAAFLTNDTTCVFMTAMVVAACKMAKVPMGPFLICLATSANIGSACTPTGNPQNMIIHSFSKLPFLGFVSRIGLATLLGLSVNLGVLFLTYREVLLRPFAAGPGGGHGEPRRGRGGKLLDENGMFEYRTHGTESGAGAAAAAAGGVEGTPRIDVEAPEGVAGPAGPPGGRGAELEERWGGGLAPPALPAPSASPAGTPVPPALSTLELLRATPRPVLLRRFAIVLIILGVVIAFLAGAHLSWTAIAGAWALIVLDFRDPAPLFELVDWSLLMFFCGLFIVVRGFSATGIPVALWDDLLPLVSLSTARGLFVYTLILLVASNVVSNVPTVLIVAPLMSSFQAYATRGWYQMAFITTVAGNFTLIGSVANIIVAQRAKDHYVLGFWEYLRVGLPSTALALLLGVLAISLVT
eukprot:tig00000057_g17.t1